MNRILSFYSLFMLIQLTICKENIVCYFTNYAQYRPDKASYMPVNVDANLCDVIVYAFTKIFNNSMVPIEWNDDTLISQIVDLKNQNPNLRVLIAAGGHGNSYAFSDVTNNPKTRKQFIDSVVDFINKRKLDGFDLDWEYPAQGENSRPEDKKIYTILLKELKEAFKPYGYLLTAAVAASKYVIDGAYEVENIAKYLDWINVMTYDYHGGWNIVTGFNAPLYVRSDEIQDDLYYNVDYSVRYWIEKGFPKNKIVLGIPTFGRSFTLADSKEFLPGGAAIGGGLPQTYTRENGFGAYYEFCDKKKENWTFAWESQSLVPYGYKDNQWITYENIDSIQYKTNYIKRKGLGGAMFWTLDFDDYLGLCNEGKYPLINAAKQVLASGSTQNCACFMLIFLLFLLATLI